MIRKFIILTFCQKNIKMIKSRGMKKVRHLAHMGGEINTCKAFWGNVRKRDNLEDQGATARIMLKYIINKYDRRM
jgi:hypothetical protein